MTFVITDACIDVKDQSCVEVCPVDCIHTEDRDRICYVHPTNCIDCVACEAACPVGAIFAEDAVPPQVREFTEINALYFRDADEARKRVDAFAGENTSIT